MAEAVLEHWGKGRFKDSGADFGGVKFIKSRDDCGKVADVMFKFPLVTKQTGPAGKTVRRKLPRAGQMQVTAVRPVTGPKGRAARRPGAGGGAISATVPPGCG